MKVREKQLSAESVELGLSADEIQKDTAAETVRVLAELAGTAGHNIVVTMPLRGCSLNWSGLDEMLAGDAEPIDHTLLVTNVKLLMSVQQVTAAI